MVTATVRAPNASDWALSRGVNALTTTELADVLGVPPGQVRQRLPVSYTHLDVYKRQEHCFCVFFSRN